MEQAKRLLWELAETNNAMQSNEIFGLADEQSEQIKENNNTIRNLIGEYKKFFGRDRETISY